MRAIPLILVFLAWSVDARAEKGWRRKDGGPVVSAGGELAITHVRVSGPLASATMFSLMTVYQADYNFTSEVGIGLRAGAGRIFNSDGFTNFHAIAGPTLTAYFAEMFYLGVDAWLQFFRFENVSEHQLSADLTLGFELGLRFGLVFEILGLLTIVPELRFGVQPVTVVKDDLTGEGLVAFGGGGGVGVRFFF